MTNFGDMYCLLQYKIEEQITKARERERERVPNWIICQFLAGSHFLFFHMLAYFLSSLEDVTTNQIPVNRGRDTSLDLKTNR